MPSLTYAYDIGQTVYHVDALTGIREGIVKTIDIKLSYPTVAATVVYGVSYSKSAQGSISAVEADLAVDIATAVLMYTPIIQALI